MTPRQVEAIAVRLDQLGYRGRVGWKIGNGYEAVLYWKAPDGERSRFFPGARMATVLADALVWAEENPR